MRNGATMYSYVTKCQAVEVVPGQHTECTNEILVTFNSSKVFTLHEGATRRKKAQQDARRYNRPQEGGKGVHMASGGAGGEDTFSLHILQLMVITRNLVHKLGVENSILPYCNVKVCLPLFHEL